MPTMSDEDCVACIVDVLLRVERGELFTITRDGRPFARIVPIGTKPARAKRREMIELWLERATHPALGDLSARDVINEGRA